MKSLIGIIFLFAAGGCTGEPTTSSISAENVTITSSPVYLPPDFFDPISVPTSTGNVYQAAQPSCSSNCDISIPGGPTLHIDDLGSYFNTFDGKITITSVTIPENHVEGTPAKIIPVWRGNKGGRNPSVENISTSSDNMFSGFTVVPGFDPELPISLEEGAGPYEIPKIPKDNTASGSFDAIRSDRAAWKNRNDNIRDEMQRGVADSLSHMGMNAAIMTARAYTLASFETVEKGYFDQSKKTAESTEDRAKVATAEGMKAIDDINFDNVSSDINDLLEKNKNEFSNRSDKIADALPKVDIRNGQSKFKTIANTVEGQSIIRARGYLDYAQRTVENAPVGDGKSIAKQMLADSETALEVADESYAKSEFDGGRLAERLMYSLADAAVALAPVIVIATAPASLPLLTAVTAVAVGKLWYEARSGKRIWNGEPLTVLQRQMAYMEVGFAMLGPAVTAGTAGARAVEQGWNALGAAYLRSSAGSGLKVAETVASEAAVAGKAISAGISSSQSARSAFTAMEKSIETIGPSKFNEILATPKPLRQLPETYLPKEYIDGHLAKFDGGATRFITKDNLNTWGPAREDGKAFVIPTPEAEAMIVASKGEMAYFEKMLGIDPGQLKSNQLIRLDVPEPREVGLRMPSGNEAGANGKWFPGGVTPGGNHEAVLDLGSADPSKWTSSNVFK